MSQYGKIDHPALLYNGAPNIIDSVLERRPMRYQPKNRTAVAGDVIDFDISNDQFLDLGSAVLHFDLQMNVAAGTVDTGARIANAIDFIKQMDVYYNDQSVERVLDCNAWSNTFLAYSASRDWANSEGNSLLGLNNQATASRTATANAATHNGNRSYAIPMAYLSGFFRMKQWLPLVGNKLRLALLCEAAAQVISWQATAAGPYTLSNISLVVDMLVVNQAYTREIQTAMVSAEGFRIPYTSFQTSHAAVGNTSDNYLRISNNNSNSLSLFILHEPVKAYIASKYLLWKQTYPLPLFTVLRCTSGSKTFTPTDGIKGFAELYASAEKCVNGPADLSGQGWIDYLTMTDTAGTNLYSDLPNTTISSGNYGLTLLAVNLEKSMQVDDSVINNGLDSHSGGADQFIDVQITTSAATIPTSTFLVNLVHRRALVFRGGAATIEV
jgi:hypothetical protein